MRCHIRKYVKYAIDPQLSILLRVWEGGKDTFEPRQCTSVVFDSLFSLYGTRASMMANNGKHDTIDLYNTGSRIQKLFKFNLEELVL